MAKEHNTKNEKNNNKNVKIIRVSYRGSCYGSWYHHLALRVDIYLISRDLECKMRCYVRDVMYKGAMRDPHSRDVVYEGTRLKVASNRTFHTNVN